MVHEGFFFSPDRDFLSIEVRMRYGRGKCWRCNVGDRFVCQTALSSPWKSFSECPGSIEAV